MVTMTYSNLTAKEILRAIQNKNRGKYVMLYLYDGIKETFVDNSETKKLFIKYGKTINSHLGDDILLLTVYDREVVQAWGDDFMGKEKLLKHLTYQEAKSSERNHYKMMSVFSFEYDVKMPALILIDKKVNGNGLGKTAKIEFGCSSAEDIYRTIKEIIDAIRIHYGDFERIAIECNMGTRQFEEKTLEKINTSGSLKDIVDLYMKKANINQKKLCEKLNITPRTFRRYMIEWDESGRSYPLPRDTAIAIAFLLKLSPEQADFMFDAAQVEPVPRLGEHGRDGIIRDCLENGFDLETTNQELMKYQWQLVTIKNQ